MTDVAEECVAFVARELASRANPDKAVPMQAYMKTDTPFFGVQKPGRKEVLSLVTERFPIGDGPTYKAVVRALWAQPHREEKYLAIEVARHWKAFVTPASLPLYRDLIVEGAWWDFVDEVAIRLVGVVWRVKREAVSPLMDQWVEDDDMWLRRTAIIGQIGHKADTDAERLFAYCSARMHETEFFIRKAIGWALREYSKTAPEAVRDYLIANREGLSGLSYREGAKRLEREGLMPA